MLHSSSFPRHFLSHVSPVPPGWAVLAGTQLRIGRCSHSHFRGHGGCSNLRRCFHKGQEPFCPLSLAFPHLRGSPRVEQSPLDRTKASIWLTKAALNLQGFDPKHGLLCTWSGRGRMNESPAFCSRATPDQRGWHLRWLSISLHLQLPAPLQGLPEVGGKAGRCTLGHSGE